MNQDTTRRAMIGATGLAAVAAAVPSAASAVIPTGVASQCPKWHRLCARFNVLRAAENALLHEQDRRQEQWYQVRHLMPPEPQPPSAGPVEMHMTLAELRAASESSAYSAAWAAYERDYAAWKTEQAEREAAIMGDVPARCAAAGDRVDAVLRALRTFPVPTIALLSEKAELLNIHFGGELDSEDAQAIVADLRRLAGAVSA